MTSWPTGEKIPFRSPGKRFENDALSARYGYLHLRAAAEASAGFGAVGSLEAGEVAISVITWGELLYGAEKSLQRSRVFQALDEFRALVPVLPMPEQVGRA